MADVWATAASSDQIILAFSAEEFPAAAEENNFTMLVVVEPAFKKLNPDVWAAESLVKIRDTESPTVSVEPSNLNSFGVPLTV